MAELQQNQQNPYYDFKREMPFQRGFQAQAPGFSEWQLDPKDVLETVEHALRGEFWSYETKEWITANHKEKRVIKTPIRGTDRLKETVKFIPSDKSKKVIPLLNDEGIHDLLRDLSSWVNRVVIMSNWTEKQVGDWLYDKSFNLAAKLFLNFEKWQIKFEDLNTIHEIVMIQSDAVMRRALLEGERKRLYEATKTTEIRDISQQPEHKSLRDRIPIIGGIGK